MILTTPVAADGLSLIWTAPTVIQPGEPVEGLLRVTSAQAGELMELTWSAVAPDLQLLGPATAPGSS